MDMNNLSVTVDTCHPPGFWNDPAKLLFFLESELADGWYHYNSTFQVNSQIDKQANNLKGMLEL